MPETIGSYQVGVFGTPVNDTDLDADVVRGNLNAARVSTNAHDADAAVHFQSSLQAGLPAPGILGRKWLVRDTRRVFCDSGLAWEEIAYLPAAGGLVSGSVTVTGNLSVAGTITGAIDGASVGNLNASNLNTGTIPAARFPATLPALNGSALTNLSAPNLTGALPAISGAALTGITAPQVGPGNYPPGAYTYPGVVTGGGFVSTGRDRSAVATLTASADNVDLPTNTNVVRVLVNHTGPVAFRFTPSGAGDWMFIECTQSSTPQPYTFGGIGMTVVFSNGGGPLPTFLNGRADAYVAYYTSETRVVVLQTHQNIPPS